MSSYRLRNWPEYERALAARGSIYLWLSRETLARWRAQRPHPARRGHPCVYREEAITALLTLGALHRLGLRETAGFVRSVFAALGLALPVPDHTTLWRRRARLAVPLPVTPPRAPLHLVVDSTGLALRGEGSWQQHRWRRGVRLTWKRHYVRVHLGVDEATGELRALGVGSMSVSDGEMLPDLLAAARSRRAHPGHSPRRAPPLEGASGLPPAEPRRDGGLALQAGLRGSGDRPDVRGPVHGGVPAGRLAQPPPLARPTELVPGQLTRAIVRNRLIAIIYAPKPPSAAGYCR